MIHLIHCLGFNDLGEQWRACNYEEPEVRTPENSDLFVEDIVKDLYTQVYAVCVFVDFFVACNCTVAEYKFTA